MKRLIQFPRVVNNSWASGGIRKMNDTKSECYTGQIDLCRLLKSEHRIFETVCVICLILLF